MGLSGIAGRQGEDGTRITPSAGIAPRRHAPCPATFRDDRSLNQPVGPTQMQLARDLTRGKNILAPLWLDGPGATGGARPGAGRIQKTPAGYPLTL